MILVASKPCSEKSAVNTGRGHETAYRGADQCVARIVGSTLNSLAGYKHREHYEQSAATRIEATQNNGQTDRRGRVGRGEALSSAAGAGHWKEPAKCVPDVSLEGKLARSGADDHQFHDVGRESRSQ